MPCDLSLRRVTHIGAVYPLVVEVALGVDVLTLRRLRDRAISVECDAVSRAHFLCRTDGRDSRCIVQDYAAILRCFHGEHSFEGLVYCEIQNVDKSGLQCGNVHTAH